MSTEGGERRRGPWAVLLCLMWAAAAHTATLFERCGFYVTAGIDVPGRYLVRAVLPGVGRQ